MLAAIVSVLTMAIVAFAIGVVCGECSGRRHARIQAFNQCIDWASLAMKGHPSWRYLSGADALLRAGTLIGGDDVIAPPGAPACPAQCSIPLRVGGPHERKSGMSEVLGLLLLALVALALVSKVAASIHESYDRRRVYGAAARVAVRLEADRWRRANPSFASSAVLEGPSPLDIVTAHVAWLRRKLRHAFCLAIHGRHELYRARTETRLYQECLLCGYETRGWTIDRRDRRLHLVSTDNRFHKAS